MAYREIKATTKFIESTKVKFEEKGECVEGVLIESVKIKSRDGDQFNKFTVKCGTENKSFLGSYQLDSLMSLPIGCLVRITYEGKERIGGGKTVKNFKIEADDSAVLAS